VAVTAADGEVVGARMTVADELWLPRAPSAFDGLVGGVPADSWTDTGGIDPEPHPAQHGDAVIGDRLSRFGNSSPYAWWIDLATLTATTRLAMTAPPLQVNYHAAVVRGLLYAVRTNTASGLAAFYRYYPNSNDWEALPDATIMGTIAEANGYVYQLSDTALRRYDTLAGVWENMTPPPVTGPSRFTQPSWVALGGYLWSLGGTTTAVHRYDPAADTWATLTPAPVTLDTALVVPLAGLLYAFDVKTTLLTYVYSPTLDRWDTLNEPIPDPINGNYSTMPSAAQLGTTRLLIGSNYIYG
jgi:hypothetical protein